MAAKNVLIHKREHQPSNECWPVGHCGPPLGHCLSQNRQIAFSFHFFFLMNRVPPEEEKPIKSE